MASQIGSLSLDSFVTGGEGVGGGGGGGGGMTSGRKHALIMDEVDGMAGNEDRGGVQVSVWEGWCAGEGVEGVVCRCVCGRGWYAGECGRGGVPWMEVSGAAGE